MQNDELQRAMEQMRQQQAIIQRQQEEIARLERGHGGPVDPAAGGRRIPGGIKYRTFHNRPGEDWLAFKAHFKTVMSLHQPQEDEACKILKSCMMGDAMHAVDDIDPDSYLLVEEMLVTFEERFVPAMATAFAQTQFENAMQERNELTQAWHNRIRNLFRRAHPDRRDNWATDKTLILKFGRGLRMLRAREQVIRDESATYQRALDVAQRELGVQEVVSQGPFRGINTRNETPPELAHHNRVVNNSGVEPMEIGALNGYRPRHGEDRNRPNRRNQSRTITCYACHEQGHVQNDCPKMEQRGNPNPIRRISQNNAVRTNRAQTTAGNNRNQQTGSNRNSRFRRTVSQLQSSSQEGELNRQINQLLQEDESEDDDDDIIAALHKLKKRAKKETEPAAADWKDLGARPKTRTSPRKKESGMEDIEEITDEEDYDCEEPIDPEEEHLSMHRLRLESPITLRDLYSEKGAELKVAQDQDQDQDFRQ